MDINGFIRLLWRRKKLIVSTIVVSVTIVGIYAFSVAPKYEAKLQLLFEPNTRSVVDFNAELNREPQDEAAILSQIRVLQSRELANRVVDKLHLHTVAEFNQEIYRSSISSEEDQIVDLFLHRLKVNPVGRSRVVEVAFTAEDPRLAAEIANSLAELYLVTCFELRLQNAHQASEWLASHIQQLRATVEQTERTLEDYRREHNLLQGDRMTLLAQQITDLNTKLTDASTDRAAAEAELAQARRLVNKADVTAIGQVLNSGLIQKLREEEIDLERSEAELIKRYGPLHPQMLEHNAATQRFREKVQLEVNKVIIALAGQVQITRAREATIAQELGALKEQVGQANTASIPLRTLERDAEASRLLLDKFMRSFIEMGAQQDIQSHMPEATVISKAPVPNYPSFPQKRLMMFLSFLGGTIISIPLAFTAEAIGCGYRSAQDVELDTGIPVLAHVPKMQRRKISGDGLVAYVLSKPDSVYSESIRRLCGRFLISSSGHLPQSIVFASSEAGEGKTTITVSAARMLAKSGRKVLVVDADLRCGKVADMLHLPQTPGLAELISRTVKLEDVIQQDRQSAADVIAGGDYASVSADILSPDIVSSVLQGLRRRYDFVLIDVPPFLALPSASVLASEADATIVIAAWRTTPREVLRYTLKQIQIVAPRVAGVVLSKVDLKKNSQYDHGDSQFYGTKSNKYYNA